MRIFCNRLCTSLLSVLLFFAICAPRPAPVFTGGNNYVYYLYDSGSNCAILQVEPNTPKPAFCYVSGESCTYADRSATDVLAEFGAEVLFLEKIDGITNYYAYSPRLPYRITLYGQTVNLHVAEKARGICVGSPIIFGGY